MIKQGETARNPQKTLFKFLAGVSTTISAVAIATAFRVLYWWRQQCNQISNGCVVHSSSLSHELVFSCFLVKYMEFSEIPWLCFLLAPTLHVHFYICVIAYQWDVWYIQGGSDKSGIFFFLLSNDTAQLKIIRFDWSKSKFAEVHIENHFIY